MAQTQEHPQDALHRLIYTPHKIIANAGEILADQLSRELVDCGLYAEFEITLTARIMDPEQMDPVGKVEIRDQYAVHQDRNPSRDDGTE